MTEQARILRAISSLNAAPFAIQDTLNSRVEEQKETECYWSYWLYVPRVLGQGTRITKYDRFWVSNSKDQDLVAILQQPLPLFLSQDSPEITFMMRELVGDVYIDTKASGVKGRYMPFDDEIVPIEFYGTRGLKIVGNKSSKGDFFTLKYYAEPKAQVSGDEEILEMQIGGSWYIDKTSFKNRALEPVLSDVVWESVDEMEDSAVYSSS